MILKNAKICLKGNETALTDIMIENGRIKKIAQGIQGDDAIDLHGLFVMPGAVDLHVHFREPGFEAKETIKTGSMAAAKGGYTTVFAMPNLNPVPDSVESLKKEMEIIERDSVIETIPYVSLSKGEKGVELSDLEELRKYTRYISDDGKGVNDLSLLEKGMKHAKELDMIICSHAEDDTFKTAPEGEYIAVRREINLAKRTGCRYHFCHMSTKQSFAAIHAAQEEGYPITCEVTPHHLFLTKDDIAGPNFKMNPPLRSKEDQLATVNALLRHVACTVATDHAPHTEEEKNQAYEKAPNGILGLETSIPLVYTNLVKTGKMTLEEMQNVLSINARKLFGLPQVTLGERADFAILDLETERVYTREEIVSKGKNTPFIGAPLYGYNVMTVFNGKIVYRQEDSNHEKKISA